MYTQTFTPEELYLCSTQSERRNFSGDKDSFIKTIKDVIGNQIQNGTYQPELANREGLILNNHTKQSSEYLCQDLVLRKLYKNIKKIYKTEQANRDSVIKQVLTLLRDDNELWLIRLDIRHFFESIDREFLISKIEDKARLNFQSIRLLKSINVTLRNLNCCGLPRGLAISSALSEEFMKYFDLAVKRMDGIYYYTRFVDDIIIFCRDEESQQRVWKEIPTLLDELKLTLNQEKSYCWTPINSKESLSFLGYSFRKVKNTQKKEEVEVSIADKKIRTIKTRITRAFAKYSQDHDFAMLQNRMKFLTGNFTLYSKTSLAPIKAGIHFNYKEITKYDQLKELDAYYQRILHCKRGSLASKFAFTPDKIKCLEKYSFEFGFHEHVNHCFSTTMLTNIKKCWL